MHRTLYSESGVLANQGFFSGLISRLLGRMLPPAIDDDFLRDLFSEVFDDADDGEWMAAIPRESWRELLDLLEVAGDAFAPARQQCRHELCEAMRMASHRLAALGMEPALLRYMPALARHESPFLAQSDEVRELIARHAGAGRRRSRTTDISRCCSTNAAAMWTPYGGGRAKRVWASIWCSCSPASSRSPSGCACCAR
jgi:site-specific recombinase